MKIVVKIVLAIIAILAILLIVAAFSQKDYTVKRDITINRTQQQVFNYVKLQRNQDYYSKWVMADPNMKKGYLGTDGEIGFIYSWDSKDDNVGKGEQEITTITNNSISNEIRFERPFEGVSHTTMNVDAISESQTKVTWIFNGKMAFPFNIMLLFGDIDSMLGDDMEASLQNLKNVIEK